MSISMKLMGAMIMSLSIVFAGGFAGGFAGAAWAAGETADVPASVAEGKDFGCGAKGQKACPMQGWMKAVMQSATTSGDGAKIAPALAYVASKPPPGMPKWVAISKEGAAKAKRGDIGGKPEGVRGEQPLAAMMPGDAMAELRMPQRAARKGAAKGLLHAGTEAARSRGHVGFKRRPVA